jgi:hypothetical protein
MHCDQAILGPSVEEALLHSSPDTAHIAVLHDDQVLCKDVGGVLGTQLSVGAACVHTRHAGQGQLQSLIINQSLINLRTRPTMCRALHTEAAMDTRLPFMKPHKQ